MKTILKHLNVFMVAVILVFSVTFLSACGSGVDASKVNSEHVTQEVWNAAIELLRDSGTEITVEYSYTHSKDYYYKTAINTTEWSVKDYDRLTYIKNGNLESKKGYKKVTYSGDKDAAILEFKLEEGKTKIEEYYEFVDFGIYNSYKIDVDGKFRKGSGYGSSGLIVLEKLNSYLSAMKVGTYEYSKAHNGYINEFTTDDYFVVYKFQEGKLAAIYARTVKTDIKDEAVQYKKYTEVYDTNIVISYTAKEIKLP